MRCTRCRGAKAELVHHAWVFFENERRNPRNGVLHRVRGGVYSGTPRVRLRERILEVEGGCGLSWRLLSAARWQRRLRTTKKRRRRCRREGTSKSHQRSYRGRGEAKRRVGICVVGTLDLVNVFVLRVTSVTPTTTVIFGQNPPTGS